MQGTTELVLSLYGGEGTLHVRYFLGEAINKRPCGCRPGDAGEYRFWNAWGLKVPKACTPARPPGNAGDYRTCAVCVWREGTLHVRYFLGETINTRACGCRPGDGGVQVLERLGPESAQNLYSPAPPGHAGDYRTCAVFVWREGTLHVRCLHWRKEETQTFVNPTQSTECHERLLACV